MIFLSVRRYYAKIHLPIPVITPGNCEWEAKHKQIMIVGLLWKSVFTFTVTGEFPPSLVEPKILRSDPLGGSEDYI